MLIPARLTRVTRDSEVGDVDDGEDSGTKVARAEGSEAKDGGV